MTRQALRRHGPMVLAFAGLGLATSIAVAWGATIWHVGLHTQGYSPSMMFHRDAGVTSIAGIAMPGAEDAGGEYWNVKPDLGLPSWSVLNWTSPWGRAHVYELAAGWPWRCLRYSNAGDDVLHQGFGRLYDGEIYGHLDLSGFFVNWQEVQYLPREPLVVGLLLDVVFWSLAWLALFNVGNVWRINRWLRVRTRRRCAWCGYDLSHLKGVRCPECGHDRDTRPSIFTRPALWPAVGLLCVFVFGGFLFIASFTANRQAEAIHRAAYQGDLETLRLAVEQGANVNRQVQVGAFLGASPLILASSTGHTEIVEFLLDNGADPSLVSQRLGNALGAAVAGGHDELARLLIEHGVPVNTTVVDQFEPLFAAVRIGDVELMQTLIDAGADVNAQDRMGHTALHYATNWSRPGHDRFTANRHEMVRRLLDAGADPSLTPGGFMSRSPLAEVIGRGELDTARLLLEAGADPADFLALREAVGRADPEALKLLLDHGADLSKTQSRTGTSILWFAMDVEDAPEIWQMLVDGGADMNAVYRINGMTLLIQSARFNRLAIARFLVEHGADPTITDTIGATALDEAQSDAMRSLLRKAEADWAVKRADDADGDPP